MYNANRRNSDGITYTDFVVALIAVICTHGGITADQIALNEKEIADNFNNGISAYELYNNIWQGDGGYFIAL